MTIVTAQMSVSVDGYYAGPRYDDVMHVRYPVTGRQPLVLDNRGRAETLV